MKENAKFQLTIGSKYKIWSLASREKPLISQGTFKGYTAFGQTEAILLELDDSHDQEKGRLRLIPAHMVLAIDILSEVEDTAMKDTEAEAARYFG